MPAPDIVGLRHGTEPIVEAEFQLPRGYALDPQFLAYRVDRQHGRQVAESSPEITVAQFAGSAVTQLQAMTGPDLDWPDGS
jgi:hypothetical protein